MKIVSLEQNTPEWNAFRNEKIGASDAPIIMGVSPYQTPYDLFATKCLNRPNKVNGAMLYGRKNEEPARQLFEMLSGYSVFPMVGVSDKHIWQMASFDGMTMDYSVLVEIKCANEKDHAIAKENRVPDKYYPQLQHQLAVSGLDEMFYFSYRKEEGVIVKVKKDLNYIEKLIEREEAFYIECIVMGIPPEEVVCCSC
ncbi:MAG: YqaJ viral recombinase family protein [Chlamydiales bacterium]|nr:YqaJ viral recombinase family protein [Chlamydiales bacterium]